MSIGLVLLGMGFRVFFFACYGMEEKRERVCTQERKRMEIRERPCETQNWVSPSLCYSQQGTNWTEL